MFSLIQPSSVLERPKIWTSDSNGIDTSNFKKVGCIKPGTFWESVLPGWSEFKLELFQVPTELYALPFPPTDIYSIFKTGSKGESGISLQYFMELFSGFPFDDRMLIVESGSDTIKKALTYENIFRLESFSQKLYKIEHHLETLHINLPTDEWNHHFSQYFLFMKIIENTVLEEDTFSDFSFAYYEREAIYAAWQVQAGSLMERLKKVSPSEEQISERSNALYLKMNSDKRLF